ncbi:pescadillo like protein [Guillardia theta CCMP2712]|uniref:Pescadillo homolog n=2 Tax=Guillardia theta TaxID=55529 RepID=L1IW17_GUITC|nr:pescadillo like protein [Guillardia theta CCMP2712]EKX40267.1 pescadillo like protein [Guillardia theta CCMP2712]|eukprot:XP_005827247.1 pescadillo like protein [Guillardia theta CCMP2712]
MARAPKKKGKTGEAASYVTRNQAIKKLQVTLGDFRRLCILKGVYPRDPKKKAKGKDKTYYATKDILFLLHEPVLSKLRDIRAHKRKIIKAKSKKDFVLVEYLDKRKPFYLLDRLVKERFPTFTDAVRDMDDALSMATLFSNLPSTNLIQSKRTLNCRRLCLEFFNYVALSHSLRKVFLSIKGCYFQAEVQGQSVTWLVPYNFVQEVPPDIDYRVMMTFLEFYETQLHFINFRLYNTLGLKYPPQVDLQKSDANLGINAFLLEQISSEDPEATPAAPDAAKTVTAQKKASNGEKKQQQAKIKSLQEKMQDILENENESKSQEDVGEDINADLEDEEAEEEEQEQGTETLLFKKLKFFLSREVPRALLELMIKSFGGAVGWEGPGSPFPESDESITHQVVDRDTQRHMFLSREYVQPQWVADSCNAGLLLPVEEYGPGVCPPPHLSPFVDDEEEGYLPERRRFILSLQEKSKNHAGAFDDMPQDPAEGDEADAKMKDEDEEEEDEEEDEEVDAAEAQYQSELAKESGKEEAISAPKSTKTKKTKAEIEEERARMMMSKKDRRLYDKIMFAKERKRQRVQRLENKK